MVKILARCPVGLALSMAVAPPLWAQELGSCAVCHSQLKQPFKESAHARSGMTCVDCHGGDPRDTESTAMAHGLGFRGRFRRGDIPGMCASCHADRMRMRQYGLPADQLADYQFSEHGQALAQGDTRVAVCTDCHTSHHILPPDDPRSTVHPANIPDTCARCHADEELMGRYRLPTDQHQKYASSVHGQALLEGGNMAAPSCASCHSSHGAVPPGVGEIGNVCGQCHADVQEVVMKGPHGRPSQAGAMEICVSCHGHHAIERSQPEMLTSTCRPCHRPGGTAWQQGVDLQAKILAARQELAAAEKELRKAEEAGRLVEALRERMQEAQTDLVQTARAQHSMLLGDVEAHTVPIVEAAGLISSEAAQLVAVEGVRRGALLVVWAVIAVIIASLYLKRRRAPLPTLEGGSEGAHR